VADCGRLVADCGRLVADCSGNGGIPGGALTGSKPSIEAAKRGPAGLLPKLFSHARSKRSDRGDWVLSLLRVSQVPLGSVASSLKVLLELREQVG